MLATLTQYIEAGIISVLVMLAACPHWLAALFTSHSVSLWAH